jgi:hypothetical protein
MKTFNDTTGRTWTVTINVNAVKRVRSLLDVNLLDVIEGKLLERLVSDPVLLCDIIFALVKPEADARNVSDEEFGRAMAGDCIEQATAAFLEELASFFPQGRRTVLQKALAKLKTLETRLLEHAAKRIDSPELEQRIEGILNATGASSGSWPGAPEPIPDN